MAIQLVARPGLPGVDFANPAASRAWICAHLREEVTLRGQPHPKVYLCGAGFIETFDLDAMARREPGCDPGMTFQALRRRRGVQRCFLVIGAEGNDDEGNERRWAVVFEEVDVADGRRWWMGMLAYRANPVTGLGDVIGDWSLPAHDTDNPAALPPFVRDFAMPRPGGRPAEIRDAAKRWMPDIRYRFGELAGDPPADAKGMIELTGGLGVVMGLLSGDLQGVVVVRIAERSWEVFELSGDLPAPLLEMVRWIANHRLPMADGVAIAQIAVRPQDQPPLPGVQVIGELGGLFVETWAPVRFPEGPKGKKVVEQIQWWEARPVPDNKRWIGVASKAPLDDGTPEA